MLVNHPHIQIKSKLDAILKNPKHVALFLYLMLNNVSHSTALFFINCIDKLEKEGDLSATEMGRLNYMTPGAAIYHLKILSRLYKEPEHNIIARIGYRKWELNNELYDQIVESSVK